MVSLVLAFMVSVIVSGVIIRLSRNRTLPWDDHDLQGVQKFHARAVPRVGGLAIALGLAALLAWVAFMHLLGLSALKRVRDTLALD